MNACNYSLYAKLGYWKGSDFTSSWKDAVYSLFTFIWKLEINVLHAK